MDSYAGFAPNGNSLAVGQLLMPDWGFAGEAVEFHFDRRRILRQIASF